MSTSSKPTYKELQDKIRRLEGRESPGKTDSLIYSIIQYLPQPICVIDKHHYYSHANNSFCDLVNLKRQDIIGEPIDKIGIYENYPETIKPCVEACFEGEFKKTDTILREKKDSSSINMTIDCTPLIGESGDIEGVMMSYKRISDKAQKSKKIHHQIERHNALYIYSPLAYQSLNSEGIIIDVNPKWLQTLGYERDEVIGQWFGNFLHKDSLDIFKNNFPRLKKIGTVSNVIFKLLRKDGSFISVAFEGSAGYSEEGSFRQTYCTFKDITQETNTLEALQKSERKLNTLLNNLQGMAYRCTNEKNWPMEYMSDGCLELTGYSRDELLGSGPYNYSNLIHPQDQQMIWNKVQEAIQKQKQFEIEYRIITKSGQVKWVWERGVSVDPQRGENIQLEGFISDITMRKESEKQLEESEARYRSIFYDNKSIMLLIDPDTGQIVDANNSALKYYGYSEQQITSLKIFDINTLTAHQTQIEINRAARSQKNYFQFKHRLSNGEIKDVQVYSGKITLKGKVLLYSIVHDNTNEILNKKRLLEQNQQYIKVNKELQESLNQIKKTSLQLQMAKQYLEESDALYQTIFNTSEDAIFIYESNKNLAFVNDTACKMLNISRNDLLKKHLEDFLSGKDHDKFNSALQRGEKFTSFVNITRHDNKSFHAEVYGYPINTGTKILYYCRIRDVSIQKKYEKQLIEAKEKAEQSDRLKSAFLANMSHEIRTPMNGIIGFSQLLSQPNLDEDKKNYYSKIIINSSNQLLSIVNDILDISLIESNNLKINNKPVMVNKIIMDLFAFFSPHAEEKNLLLKTSKELSDNQSMVITDQVRLRQVLSNLLNNSLKFTYKGSILFGYKKQDKDLVFFVQDTGIGIAREQMDQIFERFHQEEIEETKKYGGTGLGLSISKRLVELLGGNMKVETQKGEGTTFYFTIPYKTTNCKEDKKRSVINPVSDKPLTILVAEDEEINFSFIEEILSEKNITVLHSANGIEAINMCKKNPGIDMVLMDIKMPLMNGYDATRQIKQFRPELPIIAQTAYAMIEDREKALNAGCDDYIPKPIMAPKLWKMINKHKRK